MSYATFSGSAGTPSECRALFARVLQMSARTGMNNSAGELCDNGDVLSVLTIERMRPKLPERFHTTQRSFCVEGEWQQGLLALGDALPAWVDPEVTLADLAYVLSLHFVPGLYHMLF